MRVDCRRPYGFTLLEMLVGLTLLGILLILIYSALNIGLRAWDTGDQRASEASHLRIVQSFMRRELGQVFPVRWRGIPESRIAFEGAKKELRFVTALNLGASVKEGGLQWGHLYLADDTGPDGARRQSLFLRREAFDLQAKDWSGLETAKPTRLIEGVKSIEIAYFGAENDTTDPKWADEWTHPQRMPLLVRISVKTDLGREVPDLVVALKLGEEAGCYENAFQRQCPARRA
ncbi:MAG: prepilin-type N-terminal cleavage/methylation domain-containing protein [Betaproteobacteria bacterium]